jgi:hypothetical protein
MHCIILPVDFLESLSKDVLAALRLEGFLIYVETTNSNHIKIHQDILPLIEKHGNLSEMLRSFPETEQNIQMANFGHDELLTTLNNGKVQVKNYTKTGPNTNVEFLKHRLLLAIFSDDVARLESVLKDVNTLKKDISEQIIFGGEYGKSILDEAASRSSVKTELSAKKE